MDDLFSIDFSAPAPAPAGAPASATPATTTAPAYDPFAPAPTPAPAPAPASKIDQVFGSFGDLDGLSGPSLKPMSVSAKPAKAEPDPTPEEVRAMSVKELRRHLTRLHVNTTGCVEKSDFQTRLVEAVNKRKAGYTPEVLQKIVRESGGSGKLPVPTTSRAQPTTGSMDVFKMTGFQEYAPDSSPPGGGGVLPTSTAPNLETFKAATAAISANVKHMAVPLLPRGNLGNECPLVCVAPVLREVKHAYIRSCFTEKPLTSSVAPSDGGDATSGAGAGAGAGAATSGTGRPRARTAEFGPIEAERDPAMDSADAGPDADATASLAASDTATVPTASATSPPKPPSPSKSSDPSASAAPDRSWVPYKPSQAIGGPRYYEVLIRPDVSTQDVLNAWAGAGRAVGLDAVYSTPTSVLLQQRVTVPLPSFKEAITKFKKAAGDAKGGPVPVSIRGVAEKVGSALDRMASGGSRRRSSLFGSSEPSKVTYVVSLSVFVGLNVHNDRVVLLMTGRFLPDPKSDEFNGREVERSSMGERLVSPAAREGIAAELGFDVGGGRGGVVCATPRSTVTLVGSPPTPRSVARSVTSDGTGAAGSPQQATTTAPSDTGDVDSGDLNADAVAVVGATADGDPNDMALTRTVTLDGGDSQPPYVALRISFLRVLVDLPVDDDAKSSPFVQFNLDDVEDDRVRTLAEVCSELRTSRCLAQGMWPEAIDAAKACIQSGDPSPTPLFSVHTDLATSVTRAIRRRMKEELEQAMVPYDAKASADEAKAVQLVALLMTTYQDDALEPPEPEPVPPLASVPLPTPFQEDVGGLSVGELREVLEAMEVDARHAVEKKDLQELARQALVAKRARGVTSPSELDSVASPVPLDSDAVGADGSGLTELEKITKRVYRIANAQVRRAGLAVQGVVETAGHAAEDERAAKLDQKQRHCALRCVYAARYPGQLVRDLEARACNLTSSADGKLLVQQFDNLSEPVVLGISARLGAKLGRVLLTPQRLCFYANMVGFKTKLDVPLNKIVSVTPVDTLVNSSLLVKYLADPEPAKVEDVVTTEADVDALFGADDGGGAGSHGPTVGDDVGDDTAQGVETDLDLVMSDRNVVLWLLEFLRHLQRDPHLRFFEALDGDAGGDDGGAAVSHVILDGLPIPELPLPGHGERVVDVGAGGGAGAGALPVPEYDPFAAVSVPVNTVGNPSNPVDVSSAFSFLDTN